ncbi:MAG: alpha-glucan family phosphorylase [Burkholderiales bacterium]|nr:alpha-glucan family phosphorylase [Burkholderiales bacterium]
MQPGTRYSIEVNPKIPRRLARLAELADDLWYSWDRPTRELFARLHPPLWDAVGHSPKAFLRRVDESKLVEAAADPVFLNNFNRVLSAYDTYHGEPQRANGARRLQETDLVAYFCFEFGFHESLPIYSGGLGILAGDHCKAASDIRLPFVAVGLLYRQGYFLQTIDREGVQDVSYTDSVFENLPIEPVIDVKGAELRVLVDMPERTVAVRVWRTRAGHVTLYLLDTDVDENTEADRAICYRLYGGDRGTRIEQEIILGMGGVRALAAMGLRPTVWHINEGHAAFLLLERVRNVMRQGLDFAAALEAVAVNTVFTTHTPVAAGHDQFADEMMRRYFDAYCRELHVEPERLLALGQTPVTTEFNMTALAVRGSRFHNGVSRIHRGVSAQLLQGLWPQVPAAENPVSYVTNGVHVPTFLSPEWADMFDRFLGLGWSQHLDDEAMWAKIDEFPDHIFWSVHQYLKSRMLHLVRYRIAQAHFRNQGSEAHLERLFKLADPVNPNVLTIGFGRRFATYKRATLLFEDLEWLREIVSVPDRPALFIFAGKAHPADKPGQDLIRQVANVSKMPEFEGKILLVEGHDLRLARRLVSGVDVWLNNPVYPLEASGTSGMKAAMNGVINLSVLDGWWGEGYRGDNGWAIKPATDSADEYRRNREESRTLYEILEDQVIPLYYARGDLGYSRDWIKMAKRSIETILPRFNATRMVSEYISRFYVPAAEQGRRYALERFEDARAVAAWKTRVRAAWSSVTLRRLDAPLTRITFGDAFTVQVAVKLNGLAPDDVIVELLLRRAREHVRYELVPVGPMPETGEHRFALELTPDLCGQLDYRIRAYPCHAQLTHPLELGLMIWA